MNTTKRMDNRQRNKISLLFQSKSKIGNPKSKIGLTLIEVMVVVLIIAVAVLGAMGFRLYCVTDAKKADVQAGAIRFASMILEDWKASGKLLTGSDPYNAVARLGISTQFAITGTSPNYQIQDSANSVYYNATLIYTNATSATPKALTVVMSWRRGYGTSGSVEHSRSLTTYAN